jgi:hypothetical protein
MLSSFDVRDLKLPLDHGSYRLCGKYSQANKDLLIAQSDDFAEA